MLTMEVSCKIQGRVFCLFGCRRCVFVVFFFFTFARTCHKLVRGTRGDLFLWSRELRFFDTSVECTQIKYIYLFHRRAPRSWSKQIAPSSVDLRGSVCQ